MHACTAPLAYTCIVFFNYNTDRSIRTLLELPCKYVIVIIIVNESRSTDWAFSANAH